jgi:3-oxo-5alpha-steroid 4-dehydrogenase
MTSWDGEFDVVVVGFGGAGSAAALEARSEGARVLVIDRFAGGGATARSGGVYYAGGGSIAQRRAGYADDPEEMFSYLRLEVRDAVDEATLRNFCEQSLANLDWLQKLGVPFPPSGVPPRKTSYPEHASTLYFSGNELAAPYSRSTRPAPRGHRVSGKGSTGHVLF